MFVYSQVPNTSSLVNFSEEPLPHLLLKPVLPLLLKYASLLQDLQKEGHTCTTFCSRWKPSRSIAIHIAEVE